MKKIIVVLLTVAMVLAATPIAFAETTVVKGDGKLAARGAGSVSIEATGTVELTGVGYLIINDPNGTAKIRFRGKARRIWKEGSTIHYQGFRGRIFVKGDNLKIHFNGRASSLLTKGSGKAVFNGKWIIYTRGRKVNAPNGSEVPITQ